MFDDLVKQQHLVSLERLYNTVLKVHKSYADDLCWMDIDRIFVAAGLSVPDRKVGDKFKMLKNCARYIDHLCTEGGGWKSYEELEKENKELRERVEYLEEQLSQRVIG